jgi:hypothetical protein
MMFYTRFIDDVCGIMRKHEAEEYIRQFNAINCSIQFDMSSVTTKRIGVMLDMELEFEDDGTIGMSVYQKLLNKYQYIPPFSSHRRHIFVNFIRNELRRYRLLSSSKAKYEVMSDRFLQRLLARGYTIEMFAEASFDLPSRESILAQLREKIASRQEGAKPAPPLTIHVRMPTLERPLKLGGLIRQSLAELTTEMEYRRVYGRQEPMASILPEANISKTLVRSRLR